MHHNFLRASQKASINRFLLTCVTVEMCKVSETGVGACIHIGRGCKDVSAQVTEKVKLLVMELLGMGLSTADHWRLTETIDIFEKNACVG